MREHHVFIQKKIEYTISKAKKCQCVFKTVIQNVQKLGINSQNKNEIFCESYWLVYSLLSFPSEMFGYKNRCVSKICHLINLTRAFIDLHVNKMK